MDLAQLIESFESFSELLDDESSPKINASELRQILRQGAAVLTEMQPAIASAEKLKQLLEAELLRKLRAVSELTSRKTPLMERLIRSEKLSLEELMSLKGDVDREFDTAFSQQLKDTSNSTANRESFSEFKV